MRNPLLLGTLTLCAFLSGYTSFCQTGNTGVGTTTPGSKLTVNGSMAAQYTTVAASGTVGANDFYIAYNGSADGTLTLPAAISGTGNFMGRMYHFKNTGTAVLTIAANGTELIDNQSGAGVASVKVPAGYYAFFIAKGTTTGTTWELVLLSSANSVPAAASTYPFSATPTSSRQTCTATVGAGPYVRTEIKYPQGAIANTANVLDTANGRFTAPASGYYLFYGATQFDNGLVAGNPTFAWAILYLVKNAGGANTILVQSYESNPGTVKGVNASCITYLNAGETVSMAGAAQVSGGTEYQVVVSTLYGYKIAN
ncbi:hypothetical protein [Taibaiella koreensis]|uniref:hypothetical protein n=1 Tax=Taibaiella koreensis TaxID=1268548 RepID=UPI000E59E8CD|nr:hypothetical protein [Taibaiella koreensis]